MTKTDKPVPASPMSHARRLSRIQGEMDKVSRAQSVMPQGDWLRRMAGCRREMAAIYRGAARDRDPESIEWHAMTDAAILLDLHAQANLNAAKLHEAAGTTAEARGDA